MKNNLSNLHRATSRSLAIIISVAMLLSSTALISVHAAAGDLDVTFGSSGKVTTGFTPGGQSQGSAVVVQKDGKTLAVGVALDSNFDQFVTVARYDINGALDQSFGTEGRVFVDGFLHYANMVADIALQADEKIVVVSATAPPNTQADFGIARLNSDGTLDQSFGVGGKVTTDFFGFSDEANAVAIQNDGKIVVAGLARTGFYSDFALVRYEADGSLDQTFGVGGKVTTDFAGFGDEANGVAVQNDGKLVAVGGSATDQTYRRDFAVARYNADGTPDMSFDADGKLTTHVSEVDIATSIVVQPNDGGIVVAGGSVIPNNIGGFTDFAILRYTSTGMPDPTFGNSGLVLTDFSGAGDFANDVALQSDGKIVAAGYRKDPLDVEMLVDFALTRYDTNGNLDPTFGTGGKVITDFGNVEYGYGMALTPDCKIVMVGYTWPLPDGDLQFALARYDIDGCLVSSFHCPLSQGHWKNNTSLWPVNSLTLGNQTYSKSELLAILNTKTTGDASTILATQLIAAKLNIAYGSDPTPVSATIADADNLLSGFSGKLPYKVKSSSSIGQAMTTDGTVLGNYNYGLLTPSCIP